MSNNTDVTILPETKNYQKNYDVIINGNKYQISYDEERRCYQLSDPNYGFLQKLIDWFKSWFGIVSPAKKSGYFIKDKLEDANLEQGYYFEIVGNNHFAIDARALNYLAQNNFAIAADNQKITLEKTKDRFLNTQTLYKISNSNIKLEDSKDYSIAEKKFLFSDDYMLLTAAMKEKLENSAFIFKDRNNNKNLIYTNLSGEKFELIKDDQFRGSYRLYSLDNENLIRTSKVNNNLKQWITIFSKEEPHVKKTNNGYLLNQSAYEKYFCIEQAKNLSSQLSTEFVPLAQKEINERAKIKDYFINNKDEFNFTEDEFQDLQEKGDRIWIDDKGKYHACIDAKEQVFISTAVDDKKGIPQLAFKGYLKGDCALRRKEPYALPVIPTFRRRMKFYNSADKSGPTIIIDGGDDTATALTSSGLPQKTALALQSFLIFPAFLSMVNIGVQGLLGESEDTKDELAEIEEKIFNCADKISGLKASTEQIRKLVKDGKKRKLTSEEKKELSEKVQECYEAVNELKEQIEEKSKQIFENKAANTGYVAMLNMFSAVTAYQISAFTKFVDSFQSTPSTVAEDIAHVFDIVGKSTAGVGQVLMTCFATAKSYSAYQDLQETNEDLENIKNSKILNELAKEIAIAYKNDEKFLHKTQIIGNATLAAGQATMFVGGVAGVNPATYAGLAATLGGVVVNTAGSLWHTNLYAHNEDPDEVETEIKKENNNRLFTYFIEQCNSKKTQEKGENQGEVTAIYKKNICNMELLSALRTTSIVANQIFAQGYNNNDIAPLKKKYKENLHQAGFYNLLTNLSESNNKILTQKKGNNSTLGYNLLWQKALDSLQVTEDDIKWMAELSEILTNYKKDSQVDINKLNDNTPEKIKTAIADFNKHSNKTYDNLLTTIQNGFIEHRFKENDIGVFAEKLNNSNKSLAFEQECNKELKDKIFADKGFVQKFMQHEYSENNPGSLNIFSSGDKKKGNYHNNSKPLKIVGQISKDGGGIFHNPKNHIKNVYALNKERVSSSDYQCDNDFIAQYKENDTQYDLRSGYHRCINNIIDQVNKEQDKNISKDIKKIIDNSYAKSNQHNHGAVESGRV